MLGNLLDKIANLFYSEFGKMFNQKEIELEILNFWQKHKIYEKVKKKNSRGKDFYFLQGPPYTSGRLHIGHAWNNSMKDIALRYKRMCGYNVFDRAGYDMHGLPTENAVQKKLKLKDKAEIINFGVDKFIKECESFSITNAKLMDHDLERLGVWLDYKNAYYPLRNSFIESEWWFIKRAFEEKRLYKGEKVMHWCSSCETSLAKHELEYENVNEKSIFLKFEIGEGDGKWDESEKDNTNGKTEIGKASTPTKTKKTKEYIIIWTTTPWTIPFNLAVMVNPELEYVKAEVELETKDGTKKENWIIAKSLADGVIKVVLEKNFRILEEFKGKKLEGLKYRHPFYQEIKKHFDEIARQSKSKFLHSVILSEEYVDASSGSGLVHCSPGSGPEDFEVGSSYSLPAFNTLDEKGYFKEIQFLQGMQAKKDDKKIIELLEANGSLIKVVYIEHEYPFCWRCHKQVIFRATEQWFLKIEDLVPKMLKYNEEINWQPKFGKSSFASWLKSLRDNGITRQRFWGTPAPIYECECGEVTVVGNISELKKLATKTSKIPDDLHKPFIDKVKIKCRKCGLEVSRIPDVLDVWLDSGILAFAALEYPHDTKKFKKLFPADFILEATEQVKLWFSMLNICSEIAFKRNGFKNVYMHGMILDWHGMKMSKSLGNIVSPYEVIDKSGADILRYYMCATTSGENMNFSWKELETKQKTLLIFWNVHRYILELAAELNVNPEKISAGKNIGNIGIEEKYILSRLNSTIQEVTELLEAYKLDSIISKLEDMYLELSRFYIQLIREKISLGTENEKRAVLYTMYKVYLENLNMLSIVVPFTTEKIFQNLRHEFKLKHESIHLNEWPKVNKKQIDKHLEKDFEKVKDVLKEILAAREKEKIGIRWPIKFIQISGNKEVVASVKKLEKIIKGYTNVKEIKILSGKNLEVKVDTTLTQELLAEGFSREFSRKIQDTRKNLKLFKTEVIELKILVDKEMQNYLKKFEQEIKMRVNAKKILIVTETEKDKEWKDEKNIREEKIKNKVIKFIIKKL